MACLMFNQAVGVKPSLVGYRGTGPAMNDLVGGHVDFICEQVVSVASQINGGSVKAYAVSASDRLSAIKDVPTAKEAGVKYDISIWSGIFAPRGTPRDVVSKLAAALDKALDDPDVQKKLQSLGGSIPKKAERTPATFEKMVNAERERWNPILKAASATK
jgi:tripartite-type tricarboxylate transporter receptor subunit TctC